MLFAQEKHAASQVSAKKRNKWMKEQSVKLNNFQPIATTEKAEIRENELMDGSGTRLSVEIRNKGYLVTKDNGWIYFVAHSAHENPKVGDITLAIDHNKNIFMYTGHVCGGYISFGSEHLKEINNVHDFFQYFTTDEKNDGWKKVK
jgi:hypothetical protein